MASLDQDIRGALQVAALAVPGMPPQSQVAFENKLFSSTPKVPWARFTLVPASSRPFSTNVATKRHDGLFAIDLFVPANTGTGTIEALSNAVRDAFSAGRRFVFDGIAVAVDYSERSQVMDQKPDWLMCAVTIKWHCFSPQN